MPPATRTRTDVAETGSAASVVVPPPAEESYVVTAAAIVIQVGRKARDTQRYMRGQILPARIFQADPVQIETLTTLGAISLNDGTPKRALTPQAAVRFAGEHVADPARPAIDQGVTIDATADGLGLTEAPGIVHEDVEDEFRNA